MVIFPLGLVSKSKHIPYATIAIAVITAFYSIVQFSLGDDFEETFFHGPARKEFSIAFKKYLQDRCELMGSLEDCAQIGYMPRGMFLNPRFFEKVKETKEESRKEITNFIKSEFVEAQLNSPEHPLFEQYQNAKNELKNFAKEKALLSSDNLNLISVFHSLFLHGGYMHLIGNMLMFIFLAFPVEERMGSVFFGLTYFASGIFGSGLNVFLDADLPLLLGASSSVSGVAGALTLFFWNNFARVFVSFFFVMSRVVSIPVFLYVPLFIVAGDVVGTMDSFTNVAHVAHLGGFAMGAFLAALYHLVMPLPSHFTYPFELDFYKKSKETTDSTERFRIFREWLYYCPLNLYAFKGLVNESKRIVETPEGEERVERFFVEAFHEIAHANRKNPGFFKMLPLSWLAHVPEGEDVGYLVKTHKLWKTTEKPVNSFKLSFLILKELEWKSKEWQEEIHLQCQFLLQQGEYREAVTRLIRSQPELLKVLREQENTHERIA
ncbi:MAG: rhomboid family intramembrane serine protease [Bdellovibrionales bacterium]|nr:rhomboid family intramembrane serine protease [Bdellovibrionales bacterium]